MVVRQFFEVFNIRLLSFEGFSEAQIEILSSKLHPQSFSDKCSWTCFLCKAGPELILFVCVRCLPGLELLRGQESLQGDDVAKTRNNQSLVISASHFSVQIKIQKTRCSFDDDSKLYIFKSSLAHFYHSSNGIEYILHLAVDPILAEMIW